MTSIEKLVVKCKQRFNQLLSLLDDSNNSETAVETFMKDVEGEKQSEIQTEPTLVFSQNSLYVDPSNDFFNDKKESKTVNTHMYDKTEAFDEEIDGDIDNMKNPDCLLMQKDDYNDKTELKPENVSMCEKTEIFDEEKHNTESLVQTGNATELPLNILDNSASTDSNPSETIISDSDPKIEKLLKSLSGIIEELDSLSTQTEDSNAKTVIEFCQNRLLETLFTNSCDIIDSDSLYDNNRHSVRPISIVSKDTPITDFLRVGALYKGKVLLKAIVKTS